MAPVPRDARRGQLLNYVSTSHWKPGLGDIAIEGSGFVLSVVFACACFSLARAGKNAANGVRVGIAELFIVGIAELFIDRSRFVACLAGIMMFRCSGHLD